MSKLKFKINIPGVSEALTRPAAVAVLEAQAAAAIASSGGKLVAETSFSPGGGNVPARARVRIGYPASMPAVVALRNEAKHGLVARALGSAGSG